MNADRRGGLQGSFDCLSCVDEELILKRRKRAD
jgi:hypothetical protein